MGFLKDTFVGSSGVGLSAHVPDSGGTISRLGGAEELTRSGTGSVYVSGTAGAEYKYSEDFSTGIIRAEADLEFKTNTGGSPKPHLILIAASNVGFRLIPFGGTLYLQTANGLTTIGTAADADPANGTTYRYRMEYDPATDTITGWNLTTGIKITGTNTTTPTGIGFNTAAATAGSATTGFHLGNLDGRTVYSADDFTRADSNTVLGTATPYGGSWTALTGTWGIVSNQAYSVTGGANDFAVMDSGEANAAVEVRLTTLGTESRVIFRATDANNYLYLRVTATAVEFRKVEAGTDTSLGAAASTSVASGNRVRVTCLGSGLTAEINGVQVHTGSSTFNSTATSHGIGDTDGTTRFDDFYVLSTPPAFATVQAGNSSDPATWVGGIIPGATDTPWIRHALNIDTNTTWPNMRIDAPVTTGAITLTLNLTGDVQHGNVRFEMGAGSTLHVAPVGGNRKWPLGTANNQTGCIFATAGTANVGDPVADPPTTTGGNHVLITVDDTAGKFWFERGDGAGGAWADTTGYELVFCEATGVENADGSVSFATNSVGGNNQIFRNCIFNQCGTVLGDSPVWNASGNKDFRIEYVRCTNTTGNDLKANVAGTGSGVITFIGSAVRKEVFLRLDNGLIESSYFDICPGLQSAPIATFKKNAVRYNSNALTMLPGNECQESYFLADNRAPGGVGNQHYISAVITSGTKKFRLNVFEFPYTFAIDNPDAIFGDLRGVDSIEYNIIMPSAADGSASGDLTNPGSGYVADWNMKIRHNTIVGNGCYLIWVENYRGVTIFNEFKDNLICSFDPVSPCTAIYDQAYITGYDGGTNFNQDIVNPAQISHNYFYNAQSYTNPITAGTVKGFGLRLTTDPSEVNSIYDTGTGNANGPNFVAPTRNAQNYAVFKGWAASGDTQVQKLDALRDNLMIYPSLANEMRQWVWNGFVPQNTALINTASDGTTRGAVEGAVGGIGLTGRGLCGKSPLVSHGALVS